MKIPLHSYPKLRMCRAVITRQAKTLASGITLHAAVLTLLLSETALNHAFLHFLLVPLSCASLARIKSVSAGVSLHECTGTALGILRKMSSNFSHLVHCVTKWSQYV
jgi:hypothetical protein